MATSNILHSDAIVLRSIDYSETSRIVTLYTRERGKMGVIARGARASKSRFGSTLEPMAHISAVIHCKAARELQTLSEASHVNTHDALRSSLSRMETGIRVIELVSSLMQNDQRNEQVFSLIVATLTALDKAPGRTGNLWPFFQLRLATLLGFGPAFDGELVKGLSSEAGILDLRSGHITIEPVSGSVSHQASRSVLRAFAVLARADLSDVVRMEMDAQTSGGVGAAVVAYLKYHVEESYPSRSARVFAQLSTPQG